MANSNTSENNVSSTQEKKTGCGGCLLRAIGITILLTVIGSFFGGTETEKNSDIAAEETIPDSTTASQTTAITTTATIAESETADTDWLSDVDATIEFTVKNRVFGEDTSGRKVDIYFDGAKIGTVKGSAILITQEETFTINTTAGTHTIEFMADALLAKDMYSKYKITVSNLGAYMEIRLYDSGTRIDAKFENLLDDYIMMDGVYYIEEVYDC